MGFRGPAIRFCAKPPTSGRAWAQPAPPGLGMSLRVPDPVHDDRPSARRPRAEASPNAWGSSSDDHTRPHLQAGLEPRTLQQDRRLPPPPWVRTCRPSAQPGHGSNIGHRCHSATPPRCSSVTTTPPSRVRRPGGRSKPYEPRCRPGTTKSPPGCSECWARGHTYPMPGPASATSGQGTVSLFRPYSTPCERPGVRPQRSVVGVGGFCVRCAPFRRPPERKTFHAVVNPKGSSAAVEVVWPRPAGWTVGWD